MQLAEMSTKPSYEDLMPKIEPKETRESHILLVHVPAGFAREHIGAKVEFDYGRVRIFGERPLQNNTIKRFNLPYQVPPTCDINRLGGKFAGGIVTITMPKKVISDEEPDQKPQPTDQKPDTDQASITPEQETEASPDKDQAPTTLEQETEPSSDEDQVPKTPEQEAEPSSDEDQVPTTPEQETEPSPDEDQLPKTPAQETEASPDEDQAPESPAQDTEPSPDEDQPHKTPAQETEPSPDEDQAHKTPAHETEPSPDKDQAPEPPVQETKPSPDKGPEGIPPQSTTKEDQQKIAAKVEDQRRQGGISNQDPRSPIAKTTKKDQKKVITEPPAKRIKDLADSASRAVTRLAKRFDEQDKQKLIFVGATVVVVALGVYASYKLRTSLKK